MPGDPFGRFSVRNFGMRVCRVTTLMRSAGPDSRFAFPAQLSTAATLPPRPLAAVSALLSFFFVASSASRPPPVLSPPERTFRWSALQGGRIDRVQVRSRVNGR